MRTLLAVTVAVSLTLFLASLASAQTKEDIGGKAALDSFQRDLKNMTANVAALRDELCPKQTNPQVCRIEFGTTTVIASNIGVAMASAQMAAVVGDNAGLEESVSKAKHHLDRLTAKLDELIKKYKVD